ncbi:DUF6449 domain-containing protein [Petroclostridium sp. X23]|uniref:DUF6449 domain-containing protein n=1 Tax=Petroclostridium sp. X23 TaxID=3045146 RepID=UPI0024AE119D|nr:DUF6449 domain-containing protein [Petroclostridium sp. X23]WHH58869.1 DUF6449 domain-containing protein [Petroclostridium sp. X23]
MKSKMFSFNRGLIISDIKRFWSISILYGIVLLFVLPVRQMMIDFTMEDQEWIKEALLGMLQFDTGNAEMQLIFMVVVPVILAVLLFSYLHGAKATAMVHTLPVNRKSLFLNHVVSGILLLSFPVLLTGGVLAVVRGLSVLNEYYSLINILEWVGITLLFNYLLFAIAVFVGMFTGNAFAHIVFTYIINILPLGVYILAEYNVQQLLYGYNSASNERFWIQLLPVLKVLDGMVRLELLEIIGYAFAVLAFLILAVYAYEKRPLESAGDVVAFPLVRPVFKYGVTACCMLLGGAYFSSMYDAFGMLILGYFISSLIGYIIAQVLLDKSFRIWHAYKGYVIYAAIVMVLLTGISVDALGYVRRVPSADQVEKVYFGHNYYEWEHFEKGKDPKNEELGYTDMYFFKDGENVDNIIRLHKYITQKPYNKRGRMQYIIYTLKSGKHLIRSYIIDEEYFAPQLKPICESMEYKRARFPVLVQNSEDIKLVEIRNNRIGDKSLLLTDGQELQEFITVLQNDIKRMDYEKMTDPINRNIDIYITDQKNKSRELRYEFRDNYASLSQWLKKKGYYDKIRLIPADVKYVMVEKNEAYYGNGDTDDDSEEQIKIEDSSMIQELIDLDTKYEYVTRSQRKYEATFYTKSGSRFRSFISEEAVLSERLTESLKQLYITH